MHAVCERATEIAAYLRLTVEEFNGTPSVPHSFDALDRLLDAQVYRLSHWQAAADEINYRRFFDINELAAVCMEAPEVFAESHRLVSELLARGDVDGLRIDHIDGLFDPMEYLRRLQREYLLALGRAVHEGAQLATTGTAGQVREPSGGSKRPTALSIHPAVRLLPGTILSRCSWPACGA